MSRSILFLLIGILPFMAKGQQICTYTGRIACGYEQSLKRRASLVTKYEIKTIELNSDSTFKFNYVYSALTSVGREHFFCTGKWHKINDTIFLTSKYKMADFCKVQEQILPNCEKGLIMISYDNPNASIINDDFIRDVELIVNGSSTGDCSVNDTLFCKGDSINRIEFKNKYLWRREFIYIPKNSKSNFFKFCLKDNINKENLSLMNYKLLIQNNLLMPLDKGILLVDSLGYKKKK